MKIISWNVAGLRACLNKGLDQFFNEEKGNISVLDVRQSYIEKDGITKNLYIKK